MSKVKGRLTALRGAMKRVGVDAYLVPSTDVHQNEYVPDCWQRRVWLSGFSGSAGDVIVTRTKAGLWTDSRYFLQAEQELQGSGIRLYRMSEPKVPSKNDFLRSELKDGGVVGVDAQLISIGDYKNLQEELEEVGASIRTVNGNLIDAIWSEQPSVPAEPIISLASRFAGESTPAKLRRIRKAMAEVDVDAHVLTTLDSIAWTFNIRGSDVAFNPVTIAWAIITAKDATLYIEPDKVPDRVGRALKKTVNLASYDAFTAGLEALGRRGARVWLDPTSCSRWVAEQLGAYKKHHKPSPVLKMKARKNAVELEGMRRAHVRDGVAVVRFLRWLQDRVPRGGITEIGAAEQLERYRAEGEHFRGLSFRTISGYAGHGAIVHYSVSEETDVPLKPRGIYLVDSGGQYLDGTTDITRTVLLGGKATREQKDRFTRVLKGHIRLASAVFPAGVAGVRLDTLARTALWDAGLDYGHGTGHGVGAFLNVHEGPQGISQRNTAPLEAGNVLSNEPGYYEDGKYGIRIENLVRILELDHVGNGKRFLGFETLTLCPIDTRLVDDKLLTDEERKWLNLYHRTVYSTLRPHLNTADRRWLKTATHAI